MPAREPAKPEGMPKGAVAVNPEKLNNGGWSAPPLWYEDVRFACKDCGKEEVWTARQQKWWHEVAGAVLFKGAVRCRACRQAQRLQGLENEINTKRAAEARLLRAQKKATALAEELAAQGPGGFEVLDRAVSTLPLPKRTLATLHVIGFQTLGDLVAHDRGKVPRGLHQSDLKLIQTLLEKIGLTFVGAPVPRV